jgi:hypothetical protein
MAKCVNENKNPKVIKMLTYKALGEEEAREGGLVKELPEAEVPAFDLVDLDFLG